MSWSKFKEIGHRVNDWSLEHELLSGLIGLIPVALLLVFTEDGNRIVGKLLGFFLTPIGAVVFWSFLTIFGLAIFFVFIGLITRYRWLYHLFMLALMGYLYIDKDSKTLAVIAVFYVGSVFLPPLWEVLSNELADKIAKRLESRLRDKRFLDE